MTLNNTLIFIVAFIYHHEFVQEATPTVGASWGTPPPPPPPHICESEESVNSSQRLLKTLLHDYDKNIVPSLKGVDVTLEVIIQVHPLPYPPRLPPLWDK